MLKIFFLYYHQLSMKINIGLWKCNYRKMNTLFRVFVVVVVWFSLECGFTFNVESYIPLLGRLKEVPQTECLKQQKIIVSQFWSPEVQNQGVGRTGFFWGLFLATLIASGGLLAIFGIPWVVDVLSWFLSLCSCGVFSCVCMCVCVLSVCPCSDFPF